MTRTGVLFSILMIFIASQTIAQQALVSSSEPVSLGMSLHNGALVLDARVAADAVVSVFCPIVPGLISFSGLTAAVEASYDQKRRVLQLALPPGAYRVTIRPLP